MIVAREKPQYYNLPELPGEKKQPRSKPVRRTLKWKDKFALTALVGLFFCSSLLIAFYFAQVLATGYLLNKTETDLVQLRKESHDLYTRVNQFTSLENVEVLAVNRLGMVKPQNDQVIMVQSVVPPVQSAVAGTDGTEVEHEIRQVAGEKREQNWVIRAFTKMVGHLEASINAG
ncbi:MAG TPA: hypothetical protein DEF34_03605 [Desulfotomaculum sp.]|nr:MAG: hypothetical protein VR67_13725 [Peptococcaceae bacterium BRH_c8a]KJS73176.1 MAG: hypothetical protein JL56_11650 [Desulfotomaculum sp. BICA1-6]HBX22714.1 hypothetical protein [Desulfotomaculum sp.]